MSWTATQAIVRDHLFKIETPDGYGTGFLFVYGANGVAIGIATADHILRNANRWNQPIRVLHTSSGLEAMLNDAERVIFPDARRDTAALLMYITNREVAALAERLPKTPLTLVDVSKFIPVGEPVGWLGYPAVATETACFFRGHVSAFLHGVDAYLIDGVSIHGLSGGPVFTDERNPRLLGSISAYLPNRSAGGTLPGLIQAYDLTALHTTIATMRTWDEARERAAEEERKKSEQDSTGPQPVAAPPGGAATTNK
jgi:trypsin-like peptidase